MQLFNLGTNVVTLPRFSVNALRDVPNITWVRISLRQSQHKKGNTFYISYLSTLMRLMFIGEMLYEPYLWKDPLTLSNITYIRSSHEI